MKSGSRKGARVGYVKGDNLIYVPTQNQSDGLKNFGDNFWQRPLRSLAGLERSFAKTFAGAPAVDIAETEKAHEITAEQPPRVGQIQPNVRIIVMTF